MLSEVFRKKLKVFSVILAIFIISKIIIFSSINFSLYGLPDPSAAFHWVSPDAIINNIPDYVDTIVFTAYSPQEQKIGVKLNGKEITNLIIMPTKNIYVLSLKGYSLNAFNQLEFISSYSFIPAKLNVSSKDARNLSWMIYQLTFDKNQNANILESGSYSGIYGIEYQTEKANLNNILSVGLAHWDANWYTYIISDGYNFDKDISSYKQQNVAFPYLFPLIGALIVKLFTITPFYAGLLVNNISVFIGLIAIYYLSFLLSKNEMNSYIPVLLLSFHPFSIFLTSVYSEGLFIMLSAISLIFLNSGAYKKYIFIGGALSAVRTIGIISPLIALYHFFVIKRKKINLLNIIKAIVIFVGSLWGELSFMVYNKLRFNDYMAQFDASKAWVGQSTKSLNNIYDYFIQPVKNLNHIIDPSTIGMWSGYFIVIICIGYFIKNRRNLSDLEHLLIISSLGLFAIAVFAYAPINQNPWSMGRYSLVCYPAIILLSKNVTKNSIIYFGLMLSFSTLELVIMSMRFAKGMTPF